MPLPNPGTAWPPPKFADVFKAIDECADWWEGNPDKLTHRYRHSAGTGNGGLRGWLQSLWWGKAPDDSTERLHMPVAADLAKTSAALLFAEPPTFRVPKPQNSAPAPVGEDKAAEAGPDPKWKKAQDRLDKIANADRTRATLLDAAETAAALTGVFLRIVWDKSVCEHAFFDKVDPDMAIPEFRFGRLVAVTFWSELADLGDKVVYRHLERHCVDAFGIGRIEHSLYMGTRENIGNPVDLLRHPDTEKFAAMVTDGTGYSTNARGLSAGYIPNATPNPKWRKDPQLKNLGRSDLSEDIIPLFDKIDELWSSLCNEFDVGRGRLFVPEELLDHRGPGHAAAFNIDRKAFTLTTGAGNAEQTIQAEQFAIRVQEHLDAIDAIVREILRRVGYSPGTFGLVDDGGAMTATEVTAKREASVITKTAKGRLWQATLSPLLRTLLEIDAVQFGTGVTIGEDIEVEWPAAGKDSDLVRAQTVQAMDAAGAISTYMKVAYLNQDWDDVKIREEVDRIRNDKSVADPVSFGADTFDGAPTPPIPDDVGAADGEDYDSDGGIAA